MATTLVPFSPIYALAISLCLLLSVFLINCESPHVSPEQRIIGGEYTQPGEFPHQVAMFIPVGRVRLKICGGSILAPYYILIAAQCVAIANKEPDIIKIVVGRDDITDLDDTPGFFGEHVIIHPCYDQSQPIEGSIHLNDIAIIKLDGRLTMGNVTREIKIDDKNLAQEGTKVQTIGWGKTHETDPSGEFSPRLKKAKLTVNAARWVDDPDFASLNANSQIIAFNPVEFACSRDAGGPLLCDDGTGTNTNVLCGITSLSATISSSLGPCHGPSIYTRVFHYRKWIANVLNGNYDSEEGCIGERFVPPTPPTRPPRSLPNFSPSSFFPHILPTIFTLGICLTFVFLSGWGINFF